MRSLLILLLITCSTWSPLVAQEGADKKPVAQGEIVRSYQLKFLTSSAALNIVEKLGPTVRYAEDERINSLIVLAKPEEHDVIRKLVEMIDVAGKKDVTTNVLQGKAKELEATGALVKKITENSGVEIAVDQGLGIVVVRGEKEDVQRVTALIDNIGEVTREQKKVEAPRQLAVRLLWLSNEVADDGAQTDTPIDASIQKKLASFGYRDMKVKMQILGRCDLFDGHGHCQVEASHSAVEVSRTLKLRAKLHGSETGTITGDLSIDATVSPAVSPTESSGKIVPQGKITNIADGGRTAWIDIGRKHGLKRSTPFSIFDSELKAGAKPKATFHVLDFTEDGMARGEVIVQDDVESRSNYYLNPVKAGDKVYTPFWRNEGKVRFALLGKMDLDKDQTDDTSRVKALIEAAGGIVECVVPPEGEEQGKMTTYLNFLVIGNDVTSVSNKSGSAEVYDSYAKHLTRAESLGAIKITLEKLLSILKDAEERRSGSLATNWNPKVASVAKAATSKVEVAVNMQSQKFYILSASPSGGSQSAFVVQLLDDFEVPR